MRCHNCHPILALASSDRLRRSTLASLLVLLAACSEPSTPGGDGGAGMWSVITSQYRPGVGYSPIVHGNSYIQAVGWQQDGSRMAVLMPKPS